MVMDRDRFQALAEAFGGDLARWPADLRDDAAARLAAEPQAASRILARASALDQALDLWTAAPASDAVRQRIIASAPRARASVARAWLHRIGVSAALAAACAAGVVVGVRISGAGALSTETRDMAQAMASVDFSLADPEGDV